MDEPERAESSAGEAPQRSVARWLVLLVLAAVAAAAAWWFLAS
jgi:hypothetical protein